MCFLTMDKLLYTKQRAVFYAAKGLNATSISKALSKEGLSYILQVCITFTSKRAKHYQEAFNWQSQQGDAKSGRRTG